MKFLWEEKDIFAGRRVVNNNGSEEAIIGYDPRLRTADGNLIVVSLNDGCTFTAGKTHATLAAWLNKAGKVPLTLGNPHYVPIPIETQALNPKVLSERTPFSLYELITPGSGQNPAGEITIQTLTHPDEPPPRFTRQTNLHTTSPQMVSGTYVDGVTKEEIEAVVRGTFGGRFDSFGGGRYVYIAHNE